ncbi:right-handed parallel beta-helix repeat-containing protein [Bacteroides sp.]|uniref:right-handed parallel beta-helix repeat-containing protein n=1 Tax=Bacteroides sp. TaxID=29523 RepID=UPI002FCC3E61
MKKNWIMMFFCLVFMSFCSEGEEILSLPTEEKQAVSYYIDATAGNDVNNGTSPEKAWRSIDRVKNLKLAPGDRVLLKRGESFYGELHISGKGQKDKPIVIDGYGTSDKKPCVIGTSSSMYAVYILNSEYIEVKNLEIVNTGSQPVAFRTGIKVHLNDYGVAKSTLLQGLDIRDVNGSLLKSAGGGSGILIENGGARVPSAFDGLIIEDCTIRRCQRNAMIWASDYYSRKKWFPSYNVTVRRNLIEEVPGDGIVPIGCVGTLVEYNIMRKCPDLLPQSPPEAAAGIWPWSCDDTVIRFNEVSDHKAPWDGQGYDSDYNCRNTVIEYNYSHDNQGGFLLICNAGSESADVNIGNSATIVRGNISLNDGTRTRKVHTGDFFAPIIHISGPLANTRIYQNILHVNEVKELGGHQSFISFTSWDGFPDRTMMTNNVFYSNAPCGFKESSSTNNLFEGNYYLEQADVVSSDKKAFRKNKVYEAMLQNDKIGYDALRPFLQEIKMPVGTLVTVDRDKIDSFFAK